MFKRLSVVLALAAAVSAEHSYHSQGLTFQLPVEFSQPAQAGLGAEELHFPAGRSPAEAEIITFVAKAEQVKSMAEAGQSINRYFASTYLGLDWQPEQINKAIIGDLGGRHLVFHSKLDRPCRVDIYERDLKDGGYFGIALRTYESVGEKQRIEIGERLRKSIKLDK
ncbi:MAG: hypothetical protein KF760_35060 [Candidatus Eremiobacteraeota bacterium]|nr:hypothetical protein [Candidatus Eremiobacteraeota bacterium]MCW5870857.1 hypothetical protein [Candidatus Eremiobacteraeota bacterium]